MRSLQGTCVLMAVAVALAAGAAAGQPLEVLPIASMSEIHQNGAAVGWDGKVYVYGGDRGGTKTPVLEVFDPAAGSWSRLADMPSPAVSGFGKFALEGGLYRVGGEGPAGWFRDEVFRYDVGAGSWAQLGDFPTPIWDPMAVVCDGTAYVLGGRYTYGQTYSHVYAYDPAGDAWTTKAALPVSLYRANPACFGGEIWVFGGMNKPDEPTDIALKTIHVYDPATDAWRTAGEMPTLLDFPTAGAWGDRLWVFAPHVWDDVGGRWVANTIAYEYDPVGGGWTEHALTPTLGWGQHSGIPIVGGEAYFTQNTDGGSLSTAAFKAVVPEPATAMLLALGGLALSARRRKSSVFPAATKPGTAPHR